MNDKKTLQQILGIVNYARNYIENLAKLAGPMYAKLRKNRQKHFNSEDIKLVRIKKERVKDLKPLELPLDDNYFIEIDKIEYDVENESSDGDLDLIDELSGLKIEMMDQIDYKHKKGNPNIRCVFCIYYQDPVDRATCSLFLRQPCMLCLNLQKDRKNKAVVNIKYEKNKPEEEVSLEKEGSKHIKNTPYSTRVSHS
jgi:hypothetical protein